MVPATHTQDVQVKVRTKRAGMLAEARRHGLDNVQQLADYLGVSDSTLYRTFKHETEPTDLIAIALYRFPEARFTDLFEVVRVA